MGLCTGLRQETLVNGVCYVRAMLVARLLRVMWTRYKTHVQSMALSTRSKYAARSKPYSQLMSKREVIIADVEWAISASLAVDTLDKEERREQDRAKLTEFLQSPFLDGFLLFRLCRVQPASL